MTRHPLVIVTAEILLVLTLELGPVAAVALA